MKHLLPIISILFFSCQKECPPPPCDPMTTANAEVKVSNTAGVYNYDLYFHGAYGEHSVWSAKADTLGNPFFAEPDITIYTEDATTYSFRVRATKALAGQGGAYFYSDWYDLPKGDTGLAVKRNGPQVVIMAAQGHTSNSGTIWLERTGDLNKVTLSNRLRCRSRARLIYNGKETMFTLDPGQQYKFENRDSVFDVSFQMLDPCEYWLKHDVLRVTSDILKSPVVFDNVDIRVKEGCNQIEK